MYSTIAFVLKTTLTSILINFYTATNLTLIKYVIFVKTELIFQVGSYDFMFNFLILNTN